MNVCAPVQGDLSGSAHQYLKYSNLPRHTEEQKIAKTWLALFRRVPEYRPELVGDTYPLHVCFQLGIRGLAKENQPVCWKRRSKSNLDHTIDRIFVCTTSAYC